MLKRASMSIKSEQKQSYNQTCVLKLLSSWFKLWKCLKYNEFISYWLLISFLQVQMSGLESLTGHIWSCGLQYIHACDRMCWQFHRLTSQIPDDGGVHISICSIRLYRYTNGHANHTRISFKHSAADSTTSFSKMRMFCPKSKNKKQIE